MAGAESKTNGIRFRGPVLTLLVVLSAVPGYRARADDDVKRSPPVPVTFGVRALAPDTPVNPQVAFVSQHVRLPDVVCTRCTNADSWTRTWTLSHAHPDRDNSRTDEGWYVFRSGVRGIDISVQTLADERRKSSGSGSHLREEGELTVGLVRTAQNTGAGLADLPPAEFRRTTVFTGQDGQVKYVQEDTLRVTADLRVPTCTTSAGGLSFALPDISQVWLRQNVMPGGYTDTQVSPVQTVVANCSANTGHLRIRFIPSGTVTDSQAGPSTILTGKNDSGQDTGTGFLMKYNATAFGRTQEGVVRWDRGVPLSLENPRTVDDDGELTQAITVTLQAFYARPENNIAITAGRITAKGLYQVSYD